MVKIKLGTILRLVQRDKTGTIVECLRYEIFKIALALSFVECFESLQFGSRQLQLFSELFQTMCVRKCFARTSRIFVDLRKQFF